jgi:hypothetical protein
VFACEILLRRDRDKFLATIGVPLAASLYVAALRDGAAGETNAWGFLGLRELGPLGAHLVALGRPALVALAPLLADTRYVALYGGSIEAKSGNADVARICDVAAFLISAILRLPYEFHRRDFVARDAEIAGLRTKL